MRIVLFGGGSRGSTFLNKLIELKQNVVGIVYFDEDSHENIWYKKVPDIARQSNIPCFFRKCITPDSLRKLKPDVIFVVGWRYRIESELYSIPPYKTIIFHDSLLPKYRGFAPMNWAIINGETKTGVTMFYIAEGIDCGDIIKQVETTIEPDDTAKTLDVKITQLYLDLLEWYIKQSKEPAGVCRVGAPQNNADATYTCKRIPEDGLIDWNKPAKQIYNLIRGLSYPYPNAYTTLKHYGNESYEIKVCKARLGDDKKYVGCVAGRVVNILKGDGVEVLTGDGIIILEEISLNGKTIRADEEIDSYKDTLGR